MAQDQAQRFAATMPQTDVERMEAVAGGWDLEEALDAALRSMAHAAVAAGATWGDK